MPNTANPAPQLQLHSFGFGHGAPPPADLVVDVRTWFRDPHISPTMRRMTAADPAVVANVLSTRGVDAAVDRLLALAAVFIDLDGGVYVMAVGCVGGRHRGPVIVDELTWRARSRGWAVQAVHRDLSEDVLVGARREVR